MDRREAAILELMGFFFFSFFFFFLAFPFLPAVRVVGCKRVLPQLFTLFHQNATEVVLANTVVEIHAPEPVAPGILLDELVLGFDEPSGEFGVLRELGVDDLAHHVDTHLVPPRA